MKLRCAVIGFAHMHIVGLVEKFTATDAVEWAAFADLPAKKEPLSMQRDTRRFNLEAVKTHTGVDKTYTDYRQLLAENQIGLAICCGENARHSEVICELLSRGIHVVVEKPMATTMAGALAIADAARRSGAKVIVNWPSTWSPGIRLAQKAVADGVIGKPFRFHYRNGSSLGPFSYGQTLPDMEKGAEWWYDASLGGGAFWDYCCYGACLSSWLLDQAPVAAMALRANFTSPFGDAEDFATITVRYAGAISILEGSWATLASGVPAGPVIHGSEGTLVTMGDCVHIYKDRSGAEPTQILQAPPLPKGRANIGEEVLHHLQTGDALHPTLDLPVNLRAMMILDAGYRSSVSGKLETAADHHYGVGVLNHV